MMYKRAETPRGHVEITIKVTKDVEARTRRGCYSVRYLTYTRPPGTFSNELLRGAAPFTVLIKEGVRRPNSPNRPSGDSQTPPCAPAKFALSGDAFRGNTGHPQ